LKGCGVEIFLWPVFFPVIHFGFSGSWLSLVIAIVLGLLYFGLRSKGPAPTPREPDSNG